MSAPLIVNHGHINGPTYVTNSPPTVPVRCYIPVEATNNFTIKCWHCGGDNEFELLKVSHSTNETSANIISNHANPSIEVIDLTKVDDEVDDLVIDLTADEELDGDNSHLNIIDSIIRSDKEFYHDTLLEINKVCGTQHRPITTTATTTTDNHFSKFHIDGYWSPYSPSVVHK